MGNPYYEPAAELVPGTTLPKTGPDQSFQPEGRGEIVATPGADAAGVSLFDKIMAADGIAPHEAALVGAALRAYDRAAKKERHVFDSVGDQTDATTGNVVLQLFEVPQGWEGHVTNVTVDIPGSATINPSAPYANAASFAYLASLGPSTFMDDSQVTASRPGLLAFAPTSAAGPILPGQWTFNDSNAPIVWGGRALYYILVGGSIAAIVNKAVQVTFRINLYSTV